MQHTQEILRVLGTWGGGQYAELDVLGNVETEEVSKY